MASVSIAELQARLTALLDIVRDGGEILVTDRGRPIARLMPVRGEPKQHSRHDLLIRIDRLRGPSASLSRDFFSRSRPSDAEGRSLVGVLEERGDGR